MSKWADKSHLEAVICTVSVLKLNNGTKSTKTLSLSLSLMLTSSVGPPLTVFGQRGHKGRAVNGYGCFQSSLKGCLRHARLWEKEPEIESNIIKEFHPSCSSMTLISVTHLWQNNTAAPEWEVALLTKTKSANVYVHLSLCAYICLKEREEDILIPLPCLQL